MSGAGTMGGKPATLHGSALAVGSIGVLVRGPSGSGKSDLAFRLIADHGARLVADDRVLVTSAEGVLTARPPDRLRGLLELRGLGVLKLRCVPEVRLGLVVELGANPERLPRPALARIENCEIPLITIESGAPSAAARIRCCCELLAGAGLQAPWTGWLDVDGGT